jgi:O-succinylbenzoic acid--CoA ligase
MTVRRVEPIMVPAGADVLGLLPDLRRALTGAGPVLLPIGQRDPRAGNLAREFGAGEPLSPGEDDPADPTALVMPTSGSTGTPKGVLLSAGQLAASAAATEARLGRPGSWLLALPAEHIAGMQVLLRAARAGTEPVVMDRGTAFHCNGFRRACAAATGPRRYVSLVPTQLRRILADADAAAATAEIFDAVLVGGAATPPALLETARAARVPVVTTYGMTETCGGCVYDGVPLDGVTVTFHDKTFDDKALNGKTFHNNAINDPDAVGSPGAIVLTGPMVARGYRNRPGDAAFARPGSFVTADTGEIAADGTLTVLGRIDDVIVTGGINVAPGPVEAAIKRLAGVEDAVVVGVPDKTWGQVVTAVIVPDRCAALGAPGTVDATVAAGRAGETAWRSWDVASLRAALTDLPAAHRPRHIVTVDAIPHLPSGKPDRAAVRALVPR